jgi:phosphohistidine phosphatase
MQLTLFRHGIAQLRDGVTPDADRKLTTKGIQRTQLAAMGLASCCMDVGLILTSPKVRALQTAELASEVLNVSFEIVDCLAREELSAIVHAIEQHDQTHLMLVGHEPTFTELAAYLCTAPGQSASTCLTLKKAGALSLEVDRHGNHLKRPGHLLWLMGPGVLRQLGKIDR